MKIIEEIKKMHDLIKDINHILNNNGVTEEIELSDVIITDKTVSDFAKQNARLSDAIINFFWPSIDHKTVYHYTSRSAAESILSEGIFRLNNIANRYNDGEIVTFCKAHDLKGYLEKDKNGDPKYRHLIMPNTFYASFTDVSITKEREEYFWRNFSAVDGVRLKIEITALNPDFRKIHYEQVKGKPIKLLADLTKCIREKYNREFNLKGISRLCSFYLSGKDYGIENEYRALHRVWDGFGPQPKNDGAHYYIELPLNEMTECGYKLNIVEVHAADRPNMASSYVFSKRIA
ncbi:hypothetical protein EZI45_29390 [Delftia tsuruhatensis]|uniref:hypothetical protein n=1 Tax=Delftia TaxID=80865 RepID=UPI000352E556|nr:MULTISPECIES: hypothetical protein [Delftia]EPD40532.1 hypothetical protein HMPREF9701_02223 [Delftia acidovorans CCUG 274B]MCX7509494.1 hypothetical protein [Delftia tsuruhatensis]TDF22775.1 hypothetical protein EZI45_29390 [Delftia tsuruhatensis]